MMVKKLAVLAAVVLVATASIALWLRAPRVLPPTLPREPAPTASDAPPPPPTAVPASPTIAPASPTVAPASPTPSASAAAPASSAELPPDEMPATLAEQREALYRTMAARLDLTPAQLEAVKAIVEASPYIGQGHPTVSKHPVTRSQCRKIRADAGLVEPASRPPCGRRNMVPLYDPAAGEKVAAARVCIDQFEFPNIACEYPVVYPSSREAALLCEAVGKRICDAHEWEGACAGALLPAEAEYEFGKPRPYATWLHNKAREVRWAHGPKKDDGKCGTMSQKSLTCPGGGWKQCGTNTYPAGSFPACMSYFGVYDQHGNAAEHMNLPLVPEELASRGGSGQTEMKGSWFAFQAVLDPHEDDCRWRGKDWHPSRLMDIESHRNYHLGFRCCAAAGAGG